MTALLPGATKPSALQGFRAAERQGAKRRFYAVKRPRAARSAAARSRPSVGSRGPQGSLGPSAILPLFQSTDKCLIPSRASRDPARGGVTALTPQRYPTLSERRGRKTRREAPFFGRSEHRQVLVELPLRELHPVFVPLASLELDVAVEDMRAQCLPDQIRVGEL